MATIVFPAGWEHPGSAHTLAQVRVQGRILLASGGDDGIVRLWDPTTGWGISDSLAGHTGTVRALAGLEAPYALWVSGGDDGTVRLWDLTTETLIGDPLTGHTGPVWGLTAFQTPDGPRLASASDDGTVRLWDPTTGAPIGDPLTGHTGAARALIALKAPDGPRLASGGADGSVRLWDPTAGNSVGAPLTGHTGSVWALAALDTPDGPRLASAGTDGTVRLWNPTTGTPVGHPLTGHTGPVQALTALDTPDGPRLASAGNDGTVRLWDPTTGTPIGDPFTGHTGPVVALTALHTPYGPRLASASTDGTVRLWGPTAGSTVGAPLAGHTGSVWALAAFEGPDGPRLASASDDGTVRLWDPTTGAAVGAPFAGHTGPVVALASIETAGGTRLASAGTDGTVRLWDPTAGIPIGDPLTGHTGAARALAALETPDGPRLASGGADGTVRLWDPTTGTPIGDPLTGHTSRIRALAALDTPDGPRLASASADRTVRLWDPTTGTSIGDPLTGHTGPVVALAALDPPYGPRLASASDDGTVRLWDLTTGTSVGAPLTGHTGPVWALAALDTPDGPRLASASDDGTVRLWDPTTGSSTGDLLTGHTGAARALVALKTPYGTLMASGGDDGSVVLTLLAPHRAPLSAARWRDEAALRKDVPTRHDLLVRKPLAADLDRRLRSLLTVDRHGGAADPYAVHLQGPWGSGKTSLIALMLDAAPQAWVHVRYDAWRQSMVGPTWWSLAQAMRRGVSTSRSWAFRPVLRVVDAASRASRTLPRFAVLAATLAALLVLVGPFALDPIQRWLSVLAVAVPVLVVANKFLFWDSAAGARLHMRTDGNPLEDVAAHCTWLRRWAGRPPLPGWQPTFVRLGVLLWTVLMVRLAAAGSFAPVFADVRPWIDGAADLPWLAIGVGVLVLIVAVAEHVARTAPKPQGADSPTRADCDVANIEASAGWSDRLVMLAVGLGCAVVATVIVAVNPSDWLGGWAAVSALIVVLLALVPWGGRVLWRWLGQAKRPLLFVVDDLDRCRSDQVVETLESIQTLMRQPAPAAADGLWFRRCLPNEWTAPAPLVFIVLADGRWIRAAFEEHYSVFADDVMEEGRPLGHLFLDKLFQLTITIPSVPRAVLHTYLTDLTQNPIRPVHAAAEPPEAAPSADSPSGKARIDRQPTRAEVELRIDAATSSEELLGAAIQQGKASLPMQDQVDLAVRQVKRFHDEALQAQTEHRLRALGDLIEPNPRSVIRLINAYEVNRAVVAALGLVADDALLDRLARWTILTIRWPALGEALRRDPSLLDCVATSTTETTATPDPSQSARPGGAANGPPTTDAVALLDTADVRRVLDWKDVRLHADDIRRFTGIDVPPSAN